MTTLIIILAIFYALWAIGWLYFNVKIQVIDRDADHKKALAIEYYAKIPVVVATSYLDSDTGKRSVVWHYGKSQIGEEEYNKVMKRIEG